MGTLDGCIVHGGIGWVYSTWGHWLETVWIKSVAALLRTVEKSSVYDRFLPLLAVILHEVREAWKHMPAIFQNKDADGRAALYTHDCRIMDANTEDSGLSGKRMCVFLGPNACVKILLKYRPTASYCRCTVD